MSRNITDALADVLGNIDAYGQTVAARGSEQREILSTLIIMDRPLERVLIIPHRNNNVFAQIAETMWVLAGRDDIKFLSRYLPRAPEFSDDGKTWRGAYGPRLRAWDARVDQLAQVRARLTEDRYTKRAVATIFDPARDYGDTLDVPCNNWLHFLQRDSTLHLNVALRANDAIWGFSGINAFEWSVLHELMASSLGWAVGRMSWFVGTMHVYERHYEVARRIMRHSEFRSVYEFGMAPIPITIGLDRLDEAVRMVFAVEDLARAGAHEQAKAENERIADPFFGSCATMLRAYLAFADGRDPDTAFKVVDELPVSDFRLAALEYLSRRLRTRDVPLLREERDYLTYYWAARDAGTAPGSRSREASGTPTSPFRDTGGPLWLLFVVGVVVVVFAGPGGHVAEAAAPADGDFPRSGWVRWLGRLEAGWVVIAEGEGADATATLTPLTPRAAC